jgi:hypothetical protein
MDLKPPKTPYSSQQQRRESASRPPVCLSLRQHVVPTRFVREHGLQVIVGQKSTGKRLSHLGRGTAHRLIENSGHHESY